MTLYLGQPFRFPNVSDRVVFDRILDTEENDDATVGFTVVWVPQVSPDPWRAYRTVRDAAAKASAS